MIHTFKRLYLLFNKRDRKIIYLLVIATMFMAFIQVAGIGSILPFLSVVTNPEIVEENRWLNKLYTYLGFNSINTFLIFLGGVAFSILTIGSLLMIGTQWMKLRFVHMRSHILSMRLLESYLDKPYIFYLNQNSSNLTKDVLSEVKLMINGLLKPAMEILSKGAIALFIIILLLAVNPVIALSVVVLLGGAYLIVYFKIRKKLSELGTVRRQANKSRFKTANEAFGAIKDIKLMNNQSNFLKMYEKPSLRFEKTQASQEIYGMVPNHALEIIAFGGILIIVLYLLITGGNVGQTLPIVGLYAYSIMRLKPALQVIYTSVSKFRFFQSSLDEMYDDLKLYVRDPIIKIKSNKTIEPLRFNDKLQLENIHFRYPGAKEKLYSDLNLTIKSNTTVAFVGPTGSGKTTLVDIILGLLPPDKGRLIVDDVVLTPDNLQNWQSNLGYVPQHIYLSDDTVTNNIAFGMPEKKINLDRVLRASQMARIHDFITDEMPDGYNTIIGERGIRLSGGQRQRIGIARALYSDPKILVLDEATSALDGETESHVFQAIQMVAKTKTVITIAHRLSTIKDCDVIYLLDHGKIIGVGSYDELLETNERFYTFATKGDESISSVA